MILSVTYTLLQLLVLLAIGFGLARWRGYPKDLFPGINRFLACVALPLYFFTSIAKTNVEDLRSGWIFPLVAAAVILFGLTEKSIMICVSMPLCTVMLPCRIHNRG
jgi:predicted permease